MDALKLSAEKRSLFGRKIKKIRKEGKLPANIYGKKVDSVSVQLDYKEFEKGYKETGKTGLMEIQFDKEKRPVLVHNIQTDPVTDKIIHVDFLQVDMKQKVTTNIPIEVVGESPAEKQGMGTLVQYIDEIEIEALPSDLPDKFEVNASNLEEVDSLIMVKDLVFDKDKIEIKVDPEQIIAKVEPLRKEEEVVVAPPSEGEATSVEGETSPAETPQDENAAEEKQE